MNVNGQAVDSNQQADIQIKPGDRVVLCRPGKGGKRGRNWHGVVMSQSDLEEASHQSKPHSSNRKRKVDSKTEHGPSKKAREVKGTLCTDNKNNILV